MKNGKRSGQAMVEYIIIVVVVAIAALAVFGIFGKTIREKTSGAVSSLTTTENASAAQSEAEKDSADEFRKMGADGME